MRLLVRYIGKTVFLNTLLVLLVLVALSAVFSFIRELDDVGTGDYSLTTALLYVVLRMPGTAYELFPSSVLLGSLLGLGAMASHSELTVMRTAGISISQIAAAVALIGVLLMGMVGLLGEFVMPPSESHAQELRTAAVSERLSIRSKTGYWAKSDDRFINIKTVLPDLSLVDVSIYEFDAKNLKTVVHAQQANQLNSSREQGREWQLVQVTRTEFFEESLNTERSDRVTVRDLVNPEVLQSLSVEPSSMSMANLFKQIGYLRNNKLDSGSVELALWTKITNPLSTLVMLMLSLPFVFGSQRSGSVGQKLFIGILLGIGYFLANRLFTNLGLANGLSPAVSTLIPLSLFSLVAFIGLKRVT